ERRRLLRPLKSANWTCDALAESHWSEIDAGLFEQLWRTEADAAEAESVVERMHLATGLLLPVWKRLPGAHVRVARIVAKDGRSLIGREIAADDIVGVAQAFGIGSICGPSAAELAELVLATGKP